MLADLCRRRPVSAKRACVAQKRITASAPTWAAAEPRPPVSLRFGHLVLGGDAGPWRRCGLDGLISTHADSEWLHTANGSLTWASDREGLGWVFHDDDADAAHDIAIDSVPTRVEASLPVREVVTLPDLPRIDHVVVFTDSLERTTTAVAEATGHGVRRVRETADARQGFHRVGPGGVIIEVVERADVTSVALWGLVLTVPDLDSLVAAADGAIGVPRDAVQPGRRIATVRGAAGLGVAVAFMSPEPA